MILPTHPESGVSHLPKWVTGSLCQYMVPVWDRQGWIDVWEWRKLEDVTRLCFRCQVILGYWFEGRKALLERQGLL